MPRTRYGTNKTLLALVGAVLVVAAMPGVRSYADPAASPHEDSARRVDAKAAPNCWAAAGVPRTSKSGDRLLLIRGSMGCRDDPPPFVRVTVKLQQKVRSHGDFVFSTKRTATATSVEWVSGGTSMRCHSGTFRSRELFLYRFHRANPWHRLTAISGTARTFERC
jgi:hypothetical protein